MDFFAVLWAMTPWEIVELILLLGFALATGLLAILVWKWTHKKWPFVPCPRWSTTLAVEHLVRILELAHAARATLGEDYQRIGALVQECMMHDDGPFAPGPDCTGEDHCDAVLKARTEAEEGHWNRVIEELTHGA